jgi:hypothetical protein
MLISSWQLNLSFQFTNVHDNLRRYFTKLSRMKQKPDAILCKLDEDNNYMLSNEWKIKSLYI